MAIQKVCHLLLLPPSFLQLASDVDKYSRKQRERKEEKSQFMTGLSSSFHLLFAEQRYIVGMKSRLYLKIPSHEIHSTQNPVAQNPFFLKIPSKKIPSFSKSRRKKSSRSQNPVGKNPVILKIPSKKIPSISKSRRSKSIH